jgi:hypothetical protein
LELQDVYGGKADEGATGGDEEGGGHGNPMHARVEAAAGEDGLKLQDNPMHATAEVDNNE